MILSELVDGLRKRPLAARIGVPDELTDNGSRLGLGPVSLMVGRGHGARRWSVSGYRVARVLPGLGRPELLADGSVAVVLTILSLAATVGRGEAPAGPAVALICLGMLCLTWRRLAPMSVLIVSASCFCIYQAWGYPHTALPLGMLLALYTVASRSGALVAAAASSCAGIGAIGFELAGNGVPRNFDDQLIAYLLSIGSACALGYAVQLSRARTKLLEEQAARLASEHAAHEQQVLQLQRSRIARDLHDVVSHQVSVITALAAGADRVFDSQPERARHALNSIEIAGREALIEMRRLLRVLRTEAAVEGRVPQPSLKQLPMLVAQTERAGLPVELELHGQARSLPAGVELCAYRIVQEALTNTLKHAGPCRAVVEVSYQPAALELRISDNGRGMPFEPSAGQGLIGMHERASLVGGELAVDDESGGGVRLWVRLPVGEVFGKASTGAASATDPVDAAGAADAADAADTVRPTDAAR